LSTSPQSPVVQRRWTLPAGIALTGVAITFTSLNLAAGSLTPMLVEYRDQWNFAPQLLTLAFAVYAAGFLAAVLTVGSLSDHIGRRPVLLGALVVQVVSNLLFLFAQNVDWVIAGRTVQGVAAGAATTAFTAALVEIAPAHRKGLGVILGSAGLTGGLGFGSLLAGLAIQVTDAANTVIFVVLTVLTVLGFGVVALSPETVRRTPGALRSMIPRISFPAATRAEFAASAPVVAAVWMLAGLSGGLAPSLVRSVFHIDSGLMNGVAGFVPQTASFLIGFALGRVDSRRAMTIGIYASILGAAGIVTGVLAGSLAVMIIGQAVAGIGFGASFTAALALVFPLAAPHQRAGIVGGIYLVAYVGLGVPVVIAGQLTATLGEIPTVTWYSGAAILLSLISLVGQQRIKRATRRDVPAHRAHHRADVPA
jgi:MFS family permease